MTDYFPKDPDENLDYEFDWSDWLSAGETITSHTLTVDTGITQGRDLATDSTVTIWLSGGTVGTTYVVLCDVTTSAGRIGARRIWVPIRKR